MERFEFQFSTATTEPPTGSQIRLNNTNPQMVTKAWVADTTSPGEDVYWLLTGLLSGDVFYVQDYDDHSRYIGYVVTGPPVGKTGYVELPISWRATGAPLLAQRVALVSWRPEAVVPPAPIPPGPAVVPYATVPELQLLLHLDSPTQQQLDAMQRALDEAAEEINWELDYTVTAPAPSPPPALVVGVNLDRAVEHWRQSYSPFGVIGIGSENEPIVTARNSWYRHHLKLQPLKHSQGIA